MLKYMKIISVLLITFFAFVGCEEKEEQPPSKKSTAETVAMNDESEFRLLEKEYNAKLGIYAVDTSNGKTVSYQAEDRFAYASTHKALAVGVLLQKLTLQQLKKTVLIKEEDLVNYNPITENHVNKHMSWKELSDASIRYSDNTAANHILNRIGGPNGFKKALGDIGDNVTNPERMEPELNLVNPGEIKDTSTPKALATSLKAFTIGNVLPKEKQDLLVDWLKRNTTGNHLIRAGSPRGWEVGDKSGAAPYGVRNDIAIIWPPNKAPIILAILSSKEEKNAKADDKLIAEATKKVISMIK
ncbi:class A beta-lactamase [Virgibacillus sp.]|uniref:class A beta-lactamase n=1 Tax=Virgibacillus sp. TaxID=1872700 RepID=UPI00182E3CA9|nr:class A beta-lactamase [Virgibacillus sp.]NWO14478.1 class A beta-lactamase [Virgibacillus sp.]